MDNNLKLKLTSSAKRVFVIVADSLGVGAAPDADKYFNDGRTDAGANTLESALRAKPRELPTLSSLGFFNIDGVNVGRQSSSPIAAYGRMLELSCGKDTITGHRELTGIVSKVAPPTYPSGFPDELIAEFERETGRRVLCNKPYSGTEVLLDYGRQHIESGALIVYTSGDSVFQIAAHESVVSPEQLWEYCRIARRLLVGEHEVGRVIARPFIGEYPNYTRTANRRDFAFPPTEATMLDKLKERGRDVIGIGKIGDIFAGKSLDLDIHTESNRDGIEKTLEAADRDFNGLCFVNLVDFDSQFGHRRNAVGYSDAIAELDCGLERLIAKLSSEDVLMLTADHGCDPTYFGTDHTREYVPLIVYGESVASGNMGTLIGFSNVADAVLVFLEA